MPKAAVGRIVHVLVDPEVNNGSDVAPAVIVRAWTEECVNLRALLDGPETPWLTSYSLHESREALEDHAALRQAELDETGPGQTVQLRGAFWPPHV